MSKKKTKTVEYTPTPQISKEDELRYAREGDLYDQITVLEQAVMHFSIENAKLNRILDNLKREKRNDMIREGRGSEYYEDNLDF